MKQEQKQELSKYDVQAQNFLKEAKYNLSNGDFRVNEQFAVPSAYDVLTALTKYDPGTFEEFCSNYGCDTDSRKAETTYKNVCEEWNNLKMLFSDEELEKLQEIQ